MKKTVKPGRNRLEAAKPGDPLAHAVSSIRRARRVDAVHLQARWGDRGGLELAAAGQPAIVVALILAAVFAYVLLRWLR